MQTVVFISIILVAIFFSYRENQKKRTFITNLIYGLSKKLGLEIITSGKNYAELKGEIDEGYSISIQNSMRGKNKNTHYLVISIKLKNYKKYRLTISHEDYLLKLGKMIGTEKDIEIRDEEFDKAFLLKSNNTLFAKTLFADPDIREQLLLKFAILKNSQFVLENGTVRFDTPTYLYKHTVENEIRDIIYLLLTIGKKADELAENDDILK